MVLNRRPFKSIRLQRPWIWQNARDLYKIWFANFKNNGYLENQNQYYRSLASASRKRIYKKSEDGSSSRQYEIRFPSTGTDEYKEVHETIDEAVNGTAAASWFPLVEYMLNLNADGKTDPFTQQPNWDKYTRIIGITWSGAAHGTFPFSASEIEANMAARKLVALIMQLADAGIGVNIITHSLGARVALGMLNIIGDKQFPNGAHYQKAVKNVFLWQPAVADNALTDKIEKDIHPLKIGVFPHAHKSAESFTVLFSSQDGVLGWDTKLNDDEDLSGMIGGAYPQKNTIAATAAKPFKRYYLDYLTRNGDTNRLMNMVLERGPYYDDSAENEKFIELGRQEYKNLVQAMSPIENYPSKDTQTTKEVDYFAPWAHFYRLPDEMKELILEELYYLCEHNWSYESSDVRPALGYVGFNNFNPNFLVDKLVPKKNKRGKIIGWEKKKVFSEDHLRDDFIWEKVDDELKFIHADQSSYYPAHSSMRDIYEIGADNIDFKRIFDESYQRWIMDRIKKTSCFGKYK